MSLESSATQPAAVEPQDEIARALIKHCHLSADYVARIRDTARGTSMSFTDAALHSGLVTPADVENAIAAARRAADAAPSEPPDLGIVETALRRQSQGRSLIVKHAGTVKPSSRLFFARDPEHPRNEQIRALRTALLMHNEPGRQASVLALLSPSAGEGRSQLAAELAISFAQLGRRTLLVDADLRKPRQHELFGASGYEGLVQALQTSRTTPLLMVEGLPHLSLMTAGQTAPNQVEMLSDGRFERFLNDWRRQYDFIVIDTPPVIEYSDALAIATLAGRVLICSRLAVTEQSAIKEMLRRLDGTQAVILGAVLNDF
jgi:protein-tyrosine kinase